MRKLAKRKKRNDKGWTFNFKKDMLRACVVAAIAAAAYLLGKYGLPDSISGDDSSSDEVKALTADTSVHFIDVGQGDATLVCSGESYMLIDTGDRDSDNTLITYLENEGIEKLDYLILTHLHSDHMGEAAEIVEQFEVDEIITTALPEDMIPTTQIYENLLDAMEAKDMTFHAAADESFTLGSCEVQTIAPTEEYSNLNNYSVIVKISHGDNSFLITGDCETQEEEEILAKGEDLSADVLKAAHHGSDTSSSSEWLTAVSPQYTVISCGVDNKYGHPDEETLIRIKKYSPKVYITADDGTVIFESDGEELSVSVSGKEE